jgi:hypothetical protein
MKWLLVILNVAAAIGVLWGGAVICAIHRVHSYSTYVGLEQQGAFANRQDKTAPLQPGQPSRISHEEIQESLKNIGGLDGSVPVVTYTAAALFLLNAIAFSVVWKKKSALPLPSP